MAYSNVNENNEAEIATLVAQDGGGWGYFMIKKKCKYKVVLPDEEEGRVIYCPNAASVASTLQDNGRQFTINNVYDHFNANRGSSRHAHKLNGALLVKI